jgi:hypothetical protein
MTDTRPCRRSLRPQGSGPLWAARHEVAEHTNIELDVLLTMLEGRACGGDGPTHGPAAVRRMWKRWNSEWEELDMVDEEFIDARDNVVVVMHYWGRGRLSGVAVEEREFEVHAFREASTSA